MRKLEKRNRFNVYDSKIVDQGNNRQFIIVLRSGILLNASCACAHYNVKTKKSCP